MRGRGWAANWRLAGLATVAGTCLVVPSAFAAQASTGPTVTLKSHPTDPSGPSARFAFTSSASGATFTCALDTAPAAACTSPLTIDVSSGPHSFAIVASTGVNGPAKVFTWTSTGAGEGDLDPWGLQVENDQSNYFPVAPHQALLDAAHFNFIVAHPIAYQGEVAAMKQVNPRLTMLVYMSGTFAQPNMGGSYPANYYLYDAKGHKVTNTFGNYMMNPTISGWVQDRIATCQSFLAASGYDGCYLDALGIAALAGPPYASGLAINPATGKQWAKQDWIAATSSLVAAMRGAISPAPVYGNGLSRGQLFYDPHAPTKPILDAASGGIAETWLRGANNAVNSYQPTSIWLQNVTMVVAAENEQKPMLTLVKLWVPATPAQIASWEQYSLASFLLGTQGRSAYTFSPGDTVDRMTDLPMYHLTIGSPVGSYSKVGAIYRRTFTLGLVLVNPTTGSVTVPLGGKYYTSSGQAVTQLTMSPNTGAILMATEPPATTITSAPPASTTATIPPIPFKSTPAGATFACSFDGGAPQPCTSPYRFTGPLTEGPHQLSVQAISGKSVGPAALASWTVDTTKPTVTMLATPPATTTNPATFSFSASTPASTFSCSLDGGTAGVCELPGQAPTLIAPSGWTITYTGLAPGNHSLTVTATDAYGVASDPVTTNWTITS